MTRESGRSWGYWTRAKLQILDDYLGAFAKASHRQTERIYLDAFAGEADGFDRLSGEEFSGSARIALEAAAGAGFTRFRYFELAGKAEALEAKLHDEYPGRDIKVYAGDCNRTIPQALADLSDVRWAPTFAFIDPDGMEVVWDTITALANHKRGYRSPASTKPEYKVELWILFPTSGIVRTLALDEAKLSDSDISRATRLFGTDRWRAIYGLRRDRKIDGAQAKEEYVNLMRWLLEQRLGYRYTHPFELKNTAGGTVYHMIFATDNDAGTKIMTSIYNSAAKSVPQMQQEARDRAKGQQTLAFDVDVRAVDLGYHYEAPWEPR